MSVFLQLPEASSQALFADSQSHIWALEGEMFLGCDELLSFFSNVAVLLCCYLY